MAQINDSIPASPGAKGFRAGNVADLHDPSEPTFLWKFLRMIARVATTLVFDLKAYGLQNVPAHGGAILATNHQSYLDPVIFGVRLRRPVSYMAKRELFRNPFFRWLITSLHAFPVTQGGSDVGAIKESIRRVQEGHLLNIYPEGTRTETGDLQPILSGVALVVKRAGVPIVPAVVDGAFDAFGPHRKIFRRWPIMVLYGPPMQFEGLKGTQITELIERTFKQMMQELREKRAEMERSDAWRRSRK